MRKGLDISRVFFNETPSFHFKFFLPSMQKCHLKYSLVFSILVYPLVRKGKETVGSSDMSYGYHDPII